MNELQVFAYEGNKVRTTQENGETWWVAKDVCDIFGETNRNRAMQALDEDEKGYTQMATTGGLQKLAIVNESGLYALLFAMQPTKARGVSDAYTDERQQKLKSFKRWVTHEVLPSIRKHGGYLTSEKITEIFNDPDKIIELATILKSEREKTLLLQRQLDISKEWYSIKRVAQMNGRPWKSFDWRKLKQIGLDVGKPPIKIFDANYGEVNVYHYSVWELAYPQCEL